MSLKDISYLGALSVEQNCLDNFGKGHYEEHFNEIIFEFGLVFQDLMSLKDISYI